MNYVICSFFWLVIISSMLNSGVVLAQPSSNELHSVDQKLTILETKVKRLTNTQAQIIQKQNEIRQVVDELRIWIYRK